jgi:hypothetical protein
MEITSTKGGDLKFVIFLKKDLTWNVTVSTLLLSVFVLFIAGVTEKLTGLDDTVDFLKLFEVWINIFLLVILLFQKKILTYGENSMKAVFVFGIIILNFGMLLNLSILIAIRSSSSFGKDDQDDTPISWVPINYDFITMAVTLLTDLLYLYFYIIFKTTRAITITSVLITIEVIIIGVCANLNTDLAIDMANLVISLITCSVAVLMWTAKVVLSASGSPLEFKDYLFRDDLEETDGMITTESRA